MDTDLKHTRISVIAHAGAALVVSSLSVHLPAIYAAVLGLAVLVALGYIIERFTGKRGFKWWLANGIFIYLLLWLVGWTYFFNMGV